MFALGKLALDKILGTRVVPAPEETPYLPIVQTPTSNESQKIFDRFQENIPSSSSATFSQSLQPQSILFPEGSFPPFTKSDKSSVESFFAKAMVSADLLIEIIEIIEIIGKIKDQISLDGFTSNDLTTEKKLIKDLKVELHQTYSSSCAAERESLDINLKLCYKTHLKMIGCILDKFPSSFLESLMGKRHTKKSNKVAFRVISDHIKAALEKDKRLGMGDGYFGHLARSLLGAVNMMASQGSWEGKNITERREGCIEYLLCEYGSFNRRSNEHKIVFSLLLYIYLIQTCGQDMQSPSVQVYTIPQLIAAKIVPKKVVSQEVVPKKRWKDYGTFQS